MTLAGRRTDRPIKVRPQKLTRKFAREILIASNVEFAACSSNRWIKDVAKPETGGKIMAGLVVPHSAHELPREFPRRIEDNLRFGDFPIALGHKRLSLSRSVDPRIAERDRITRGNICGAGFRRRRKRDGNR